MAFNQYETKAVAWFKSLPLWIAAAIAYGAGFATCYFLGAIF